MIDQLPEGKSIGWMQAPPQWIFTHTVRFMGIVRVVIQDGEGFILIKKGKPLVYYFKHGRIELRGRAALDYFNSHPIIEFNLCKYTPEEFAQVLKICNFDERASEIPPEPELAGELGEESFESAPAPSETPQVPAPSVSVEELWEEPEPAQEQAPEEVPEQAPEEVPEVFGEVPEEVPEESAGTVPEEIPAPEPEETSEEVSEVPAEEPVVQAAPEAVEQPKRAPVEIRRPAPVIPGVPHPLVLDEPDMKIIGQMKKLNGIVAISVFSDERNILLMGDVAIESLLRIARTMLATTRKIDPLLDWGSFVHMTLQIPEGNVIIAPYHGNHLCILTTRTINIGHIRRILRDLQQRENGR